jgi:hypothetical protein
VRALQDFQFSYHALPAAIVTEWKARRVAVDKRPGNREPLFQAASASAAKCPMLHWQCIALNTVSVSVVAEVSWDQTEITRNWRTKHFRGSVWRPTSFSRRNSHPLSVATRTATSPPNGGLNEIKKWHLFHSSGTEKSVGKIPHCRVSRWDNRKIPACPTN